MPSAAHYFSERPVQSYDKSGECTDHANASLPPSPRKRSRAPAFQLDWALVRIGANARAPFPAVLLRGSKRRCMCSYGRPCQRRVLSTRLSRLLRGKRMAIQPLVLRTVEIRKYGAGLQQSQRSKPLYRILQTPARGIHGPHSLDYVQAAPRINSVDTSSIVCTGPSISCTECDEMIVVDKRRDQRRGQVV